MLILKATKPFPPEKLTQLNLSTYSISLFLVPKYVNLNEYFITLVERSNSTKIDYLEVFELLR